MSSSPRLTVWFSWMFTFNTAALTRADTGTMSAATWPSSVPSRPIVMSV